MYGRSRGSKAINLVLHVHEPQCGALDFLAMMSAVTAVS